MTFNSKSFHWDCSFVECNHQQYHPESLVKRLIQFNMPPEGLSYLSTHVDKGIERRKSETKNHYGATLKKIAILISQRY